MADACPLKNGVHDKKMHSYYIDAHIYCINEKPRPAIAGQGFIFSVYFVFNSGGLNHNHDHGASLCWFLHTTF
jgi:hypothetical protein